MLCMGCFLHQVFGCIATTFCVASSLTSHDPVIKDTEMQEIGAIMVCGGWLPCNQRSHR